MQTFNRTAARLTAVLVLSAVTSLAAPASAQEAVQPGKQEGLGLFGPDIPQVLQDAQSYPYTPPSGNACDSIYEELAMLDRALGPDIDDPKPAGDIGEGVASAAVSVAKSFIPYRGLVRILTGAGKKEQDLIEAAIAGSARRGYLRGLQANLTCMPSEVVRATEPAAPPAAPQPPQEAAPAPLPAAQVPVTPAPKVTETLGPAPAN